jgi:hypothetical protein
MRPRSSATVPRTGQVKGLPNQSTWAGYVASWPAWRDLEVCGGVCLHATVCGRAQVCVRDPCVPAYVTRALARLSASARERVPAYEGAPARASLP